MGGIIQEGDKSGVENSGPENSGTDTESKSEKRDSIWDKISFASKPSKDRALVTGPRVLGNVRKVSRHDKRHGSLDSTGSGGSRGSRMSGMTGRSRSKEATSGVPGYNAVPIDKLPIELQAIAQEYDIDDSGTIYYMELSETIKAVLSRDKTIEEQRKKIMVQTLIGLVLLACVFILVLVAAYLAKDMATSSDATLRVTDGSDQIVRTGSTDMDISVSGDMLVHKPMCALSYADEKSMRGETVISSRRLRAVEDDTEDSADGARRVRRLLEEATSSHRRLAAADPTCATRNVAAEEYGPKVPKIVEGESQVMGCRRKNVQRPISSRIPDEYLRELDTVTLTSIDSTISLKVLLVSRQFDETATCKSKVKILTHLGNLIIDDTKIVLAEPLRTKLRDDMQVNIPQPVDFAEKGDDVILVGLFNDIGIFELTCGTQPMR